MYVKKMQKSTEHGDHLTLQGAAIRFGIGLMVMSSKGFRYDRLISGSQSTTGQIDILLGHYADAKVDEGHYVTLKPMKGQTIDSVMASRVSCGQATLAGANVSELSENCLGNNFTICYNFFEILLAKTVGVVDCSGVKMFHK